MRRAKLTSAIATLAISLLAVAGAWAHVNQQEGGPNGDTLDGHLHTDKQLGRGGCDTLLGRDGSDEGRGGDSGCDQVRGMEGGADVAIVCDDGAGNDVASGGGGLNDLCLGSLQDSLDLASCELPMLVVEHC